MGWETVERTEGFICYSVLSDCLRIEEIFIHPDFRNKGFGSSFILLTEAIAKERGLKWLWAQVWSHSSGASDTITKAIKIGFRVVDTQGRAIILTKELGA